MSIDEITKEFEMIQNQMASKRAGQTELQQAKEYDNAVRKLASLTKTSKGGKR